MSDRDKRYPKTPPHGSPSAELERLDRERAARDRRRESEITPLDSENPLATINRGVRLTRDSVMATGEDLRRRVEHLEQRMTGVEIGVGTVSSKVDEILEEAREAKRERLDREKRAETRAEAELERRSRRALAIIAIITPTIIAIGGLIAGIIAAYNASGN